MLASEFSSSPAVSELTMVWKRALLAIEGSRVSLPAPSSEEPESQTTEQRVTMVPFVLKSLLLWQAHSLAESQRL